MGKVKEAVSLEVFADMAPSKALLAYFNEALLLSQWGLLHPCLSALPPLSPEWGVAASLWPLVYRREPFLAAWSRKSQQMTIATVFLGGIANVSSSLQCLVVHFTPQSLNFSISQMKSAALDEDFGGTLQEEISRAEEHPALGYQDPQSHGWYLDSLT